MRTTMLVVMCLVCLAGCQSTLDREATKQNDENMQDISNESDEFYQAAFEDGEITETTLKIHLERNHKARRLARAMAIDSGNELPEIPREIEDEPDDEPGDTEPDDSE